MRKIIFIIITLLLTSCSINNVEVSKELEEIKIERWILMSNNEGLVNENIELKKEVVRLQEEVVELNVSTKLITNKIQENNNQDNDYIFKKTSECNEICSRIYRKEVASMWSSRVFNPQYAYNKDLNSCFYSGWNISDSYVMKAIVNCQTNEEVLSYYLIDWEPFTSYCDTCPSSNEEYEKQLKEYMGTK